MSIFDLTGKTAIVVGGSKGLGFGVAKGYSQAGANVVLVSRKQHELDAAAEEISKATGGKVIGIAADICSVDGCYELVEKAAAEFGQVDILFNGAGINIRKPMIEFSESDWDTVMDIQIKYVFFLSQAVAKHMIAKNIKGKIVNVGSLNSQLAFRNMIGYVAAKGGIRQLTKAMANELADYNIGVNAIGPGYFETEMTKPLFDDKAWVEEKIKRIPSGRFGAPEDLVGAAIFLSSDASDYVFGQMIYIDGGWTIN